MSINLGFRYSIVGWFVTVLIAGAIIVALYSNTIAYIPSHYGVTPGGVRSLKMTLEDGYLVEHRSERTYYEMLNASGKLAAFKVIQMPKAGKAYFERDVPQDVIEKIVTDFEIKHDYFIPSDEPWIFYVRKQVSSLRFFALIAASILAAPALTRSLIHFRLFSA